MEIQTGQRAVRVKENSEKEVKEVVVLLRFVCLCTVLFYRMDMDVSVKSGSFFLVKTGHHLGNFNRHVLYVMQRNNMKILCIV